MDVETINSLIKRSDCTYEELLAEGPALGLSPIPLFLTAETLIKPRRVRMKSDDKPVSSIFISRAGTSSNAGISPKSAP